MNRIKEILQKPSLLFGTLGHRGFFNWMSDEQYLKILYRIKTRQKLDLDNPQTFNEKLQWLKIHDRRPEYTMLVDKYAVKKYVADKIGEEHIIPTLGVWDRFDDIDFAQLPNQFVLKCTHDSGGLVICRDKADFDIKAARRKINRCLKHNYYWGGREWPYKNVPRKIIAEKYMADESGRELKDYKVFNFDNKQKLIQVDYDRFAGHKRNLYSTDWKYIEAAIEYPTDPGQKVEKPKCFGEMLKLAGELSKGIPYVRTDFYCIDDKVYFGELTFYHGSGFEKFSPEVLGSKMGEWIKLPRGGYLLKSANLVLLVKDGGILPGSRIVPEDYKVYCLNGEPKYIVVFHNRFDSTKQLSETVYDAEWQPQHISLDEHFAVSDEVEPRPKCMDEVLEAARILAQGIPQVRVDFYIIGGKSYFGEITLYTASGLQKMIPEEMDKKLGRMLEIRPDEVGN